MGHIDRMLAEKSELAEKVVNLTKFICSNPTFKTLSEREQNLMREQCNVMSQYHDILDERITLATQPVAETQGSTQTPVKQ